MFNNSGKHYYTFEVDQIFKLNVWLTYLFNARRSDSTEVGLDSLEIFGMFWTQQLKSCLVEHLILHFSLPVAFGALRFTEPIKEKQQNLLIQENLLLLSGRARAASLLVCSSIQGPRPLPWTQTPPASHSALCCAGGQLPTSQLTSAAAEGPEVPGRIGGRWILSKRNPTRVKQTYKEVTKTLKTVMTLRCTRLCLRWQIKIYSF